MATKKLGKRKPPARRKSSAGSGKAATIAKYSASSGISKSTLSKVYSRGLGAYYSSGSRPNTSAHAWAAGRVRSFATGKGGARKADKDLLRGKKKTKKKTAPTKRRRRK